MQEPQAPSQLDSKQVLKASKALLKHVHSKSDKKKKNLLASDVDAPENDTAIWLSLSTKKFIVDKRKLKPIRIPLAHSFTPEDATVCLLVKDPQRTYKDIVEAAGLSSRIIRVVGISKLKGKHKSYEARRALRNAHDIFMADDRVVSLLSGLLGKTFYRTQKIPVPIVVPTTAEKAANLKKEVEKALGCTYLQLGAGTSASIRVGLAGQTAEQIAANIEIVANRVIDQYIPGKWKGMRSMHIKTANSVALPIWQTEAVFEPEVDKLAVEQEQTIADGKFNKSRKRKSHGADGITIESVETIYEEGEPQQKKPKQDKATLKSEIAKAETTKSKTLKSKTSKPQKKK